MHSPVRHRRARLVALLGILGATACTRAPAPSPAAAPASAPASKPADDGVAALLAACQATCERRSQARAVAAEMIVSDCKARCEAVTGWPLVGSGPAARKLLGRDVRVVGRLGGEHVELEDGVKVRLQLGPELVLEPGQRVMLAGHLDSEAEGFTLRVEYATPA